MAEFIYTVGAGQTYTTVQAAWYEVQSYTAALNGDVWAFKPAQWQDPRAAA